MGRYKGKFDLCGALMADAEKAARSRDRRLCVEAAQRIAELERALSGLVNHWREFGGMMIDNKYDYGLDERMDAAAKLVER